MIALAACPAMPAAEDTSPVTLVRDLLAQLASYSTASDDSKQLRSVEFDIPEAVLNVYIRHVIGSGDRQGVKSASVKLLNGNRVSLSLVLDMTAIRGWEPDAFRAFPEIAELKLAALASFRCQSGAVSVEIVSVDDTSDAARNSFSIAALNALARHQPEKMAFGTSIPLPFGLKTIATTDGVLHGSTR